MMPQASSWPLRFTNTLETFLSLISLTASATVAVPSMQITSLVITSPALANLTSWSDLSDISPLPSLLPGRTWPTDAQPPRKRHVARFRPSPGAQTAHLVNTLPAEPGPACFHTCPPWDRTETRLSSRRRAIGQPGPAKRSVLPTNTAAARLDVVPSPLRMGALGRAGGSCLSRRAGEYWRRRPDAEAVPGDANGILASSTL